MDYLILILLLVVIVILFWLGRNYATTNTTDLIMKREEFRDKKSKDYRKRREAYGIKDPVYLDEIEEAYYQGMVDADKHPHWISVDEELPKEHERILGFSLKWFYIDVYNFDPNGLIDAYSITHWMPLPSVEHLRETTKMIEKGNKK